MTRDSPIVQNNELLRRQRKVLLSDLSSLVKTAKKLQDYSTSRSESQPEAEIVNDVIDQMILKAFKIVIRGVRFLDVLEEDIKSRQPVHRIMATVAEETYNPPTPPADSTTFDASPQRNTGHYPESPRSSSTTSALSSSQRMEEQTERRPYSRISNSYSVNTSSRPMSISRTSSTQKRQSITHRLSFTASIPAAQRQNLVSERLNASHDTFLSHLGSFIGRLHLQSQSSAGLLLTIRQSAAAGRALLSIVEVVCGYDTLSAESLEPARSAMYERINYLLSAAQEIVRTSSADEEDVVMAQQNGKLLVAATECVKAAGECVAKTKFVIERIGDFEFEPESQGLGIHIHAIGTDHVVVDTNPTPVEAETPPSPTRAAPMAPTEPASRVPPPPLVIPSYEKPLPAVPMESPPLERDSTLLSPEKIVQPKLEIETTESPGGDSKRSSAVSLLPPLPRMTSPLMVSEEFSPSESLPLNEADFQDSFRSGTMTVSSSATSSSCLSGMRDSESSMISQTSTRATTPDMTAYVKCQPSLSDLSAVGSQSSTLADDVEDCECKMLERTYAHELLHNKEGHVTGGTLPALVEKLSTHDSTPDSMFVSTFYLTFRLFATPIELAQALVDRFDYVAESPHTAGPVRLRVYNVFKGWLESHWRDLSDHEALSIIEPFAKEKLSKALPAAGIRLLELTEKVSSTDGALVPRLVSSMGKTSTSIGQYIPADTPFPSSIMSRSQTSALKNWKMGGSNPSILEFDPVELARQLTVKEMNIFCSIMPEELLGSEWTKRSGSNAVNVRAMSTLSTDLSNLVADTILQHDDAKKRAVVIKHWIKIAHRCLELNNYDSLMAIICSLNSSTIVRLKRTWELVSQKRKDMLKDLQAIVKPDKNYATLRRRLNDHVPPCLPFVGTFLTDLTFVDAGNPATKQLPGSDGESIPVINFDKHTRTAKIIGELQRFQIPYRLAEVPELQEWLQAQIVRVKSSPDHENVQQYYRKSLLLEPRETFQPRLSPIEAGPAQKDKFDLFSWTHSSRERQGSASGPSGPPV